MIDRATIETLLADRSSKGSWEHDPSSGTITCGDTPVAYVNEHKSMHTIAATGQDHSHADGRLLAAAPDLAATALALYAQVGVLSASHPELHRIVEHYAEIVRGLNEQSETLRSEIRTLETDLQYMYGRLATRDVANTNGGNAELELARFQAAENPNPDGHAGLLGEWKWNGRDCWKRHDGETVYLRGAVALANNDPSRWAWSSPRAPFYGTVAFALDGMQKSAPGSIP